jgi:hypothetical protein
MPERLRWGLLSTARINRALIPAIRASARGELVAVASRDAAHAEAYAREWGIPRAYGSYEELLAARVDVSGNRFNTCTPLIDPRAGSATCCARRSALSVDDATIPHACRRDRGRTAITRAPQRARTPAGGIGEARLLRTVLVRVRPPDNRAGTRRPAAARCGTWAATR